MLSSYIFIQPQLKSNYVSKGKQSVGNRHKWLLVCSKLDFYTLSTAVLIDSMDLTYFSCFNSLSGCHALQLSIQWPEIKLQTLTDTLLLPSYHLGPVLSFSLPLTSTLVLISPSSSTQPPTSISLSFAAWCHLGSPHPNLYPECKVSLLEPLKWWWPWLSELKSKTV